MQQLTKLLIIGHARHGKDTVAEILHKSLGYKFESSSEAAARIFLYDALKERYNYKTPEECFEDRVNHRALWKDLICDYNTPDKTRLAKEIMATNDIYVGMRDADEIKACMEQKIFDLIIGVYDPRKPEEARDSFNIDLWQQADLVIPNAGSLEELRMKVDLLEPLLCT